MNIAIVDYGMGNLTSVYNALVFLGARPKVTRDASCIKNADKLILPGVGNFSDAMKGLEKDGLKEAVKEFISRGKKYLGICLGLQLLFESSEEGPAKGLGILKGKVKGFRKGRGFKVPHMGWNSVRLKAPVPGIKDGSFFYFVHSYYAEQEDKNIVQATTEYAGIAFASAISKGNIFAAQFHPEKSQAAGLEFLKSFLESK